MNDATDDSFSATEQSDDRAIGRAFGVALLDYMRRHDVTVHDVAGQLDRDPDDVIAQILRDPTSDEIGAVASLAATSPREVVCGMTVEVEP